MRKVFVIERLLNADILICRLDLTCWINIDFI